jgi:aminoglycoside phosphotransferase (APT) family kinase protein
VKHVPGPSGDVAEVADVRRGEALDWDRLVPYLRSVIPSIEGEFSVRQFPNGSANLTYLLRFGEQELVLRRPPFGVIAPGAHDMRREYRVLSRLWHHFSPAPRAYHLGQDHDIIGSDFLIMEYRPGQVIWGVLPASMRGIPNAGRQMGEAVIDALAALHHVDPESAGLASLGHPDGYLRRQVEGWRRRWELVAPAEDPGLMTKLAGILQARLPEPQRASILHNDFKVDNCQFIPGHPERVHAVFDWDMATIGDPLADVGTLLNYWPDRSDTEDDHPVIPPGLDTIGLPSRSALCERYAQASGFDLLGIAWYEAFACFKTAVVLQQLYARWCRGESTDPRMEARGKRVAPMARRAARILEGNEA